ncbi:YlbL family protein [Luteimicrobium subarcticum]|uniref:PDZ domain-containing protein n=1 Tax=Luteimicrobium subarcticum TaxID=620910 RepID=A0A2M8WV04_9MICO|nr:PDZ domain-containing protein [Luteimicrobium subarcticum]PJI94739.1 PDZ domain-containing protein [Luteimicrobium subarcticum]
MSAPGSTPDDERDQPVDAPATGGAAGTPVPASWTASAPETFHEAHGAAADPWTSTVPAMSARSRTLSYAALATAVLVAVLGFLPAPFVVRSPGPTVDTLGTDNGKPVVAISGAKTYPTTGQLRLLTVLEVGGPGYSTTLQRVLEGWWRRDTAVLPRDAVYPTTVTREQEQQVSQAQMTTSQENAEAAALTELGYRVPVVLSVAGVVKGSGAVGVLQKGDVITSVDGSSFDTYDAFLHELYAVAPGGTVTLGITRDGKAQDVKVVTGKNADGKPTVGFYPAVSYDMPVDITINLGEDIGGPSAGTMFALAIIDKMTSEDLTGGKVVAGTGTMDVDGTVGAIGGIRQKLAGAKRDGATWFLAPASNCDEVVGYVPDGLHVVSMSTLHQARQELAAIGAGDTADLPTCS